jgi:hypothetical protein
VIEGGYLIGIHLLRIKRDLNLFTGLDQVSSGTDNGAKW